MNVVITGSTKGIGLGMAVEFIRRGHNVAVSSRGTEAVDSALEQLGSEGPGKAVGLAADVSNIDDLRALWKHAAGNFGSVDIWINNAGITNQRDNLSDLPAEQITSVVTTNVTGMMNGCKVAIEGMLAQGSGKLFNMEGFGSDGMVQEGMGVYGASKRALRYFTKSLVQEYKDSGLIIGYMSPGIVVTDLLTRDLYDVNSPEFEKRKKFLNILADKVETVTPFLVEGALKASKNGAAVRWMSGGQALGRVIKSLFVKRDLFDNSAQQA